MPDRDNDEAAALMTAALQHAWNRFNFRISSALQILSYYLVAVAVLAGAYVGALTQGLRPVAVAIGLIGSIVSIVAFVGGYSQILHARWVVPQLRVLEERLASLAKIPNIWDVRHTAPKGRLWSPNHLDGKIVGAMFVVAVLGGVIAAACALLAR
jgi:hypothetical protein